jgi:hypothetical protein
MSESKERFNPEPWLRSVLWLALAAVIVATIFRGSPLKLSGAGVKVEIGGQSVPGANAPGPVVGGRAIQRDPAGTTFVSVRPSKTRAIGGSRTIKTGGGSIQNFGPELNSQGNWQFVCVWGGRVDGDAQATCLPTE